MKEMSARASQGFSLGHSETHQQANVFAVVLPEEQGSHFTDRHAPLLLYLYDIDVEQRTEIRKRRDTSLVQAKERRREKNIVNPTGLEGRLGQAWMRQSTNDIYPFSDPAGSSS